MCRDQARLSYLKYVRSLLKNYIVEFIKPRKTSNYALIYGRFVAFLAVNCGISHLSKLSSFIFQQAGSFLATKELVSE